MEHDFVEQFKSWARRIQRTNPCRRTGRLEAAIGSTLLATLPGACIGERVLIGPENLPADVSGFKKNKVVLSPDCCGKELSEGLEVRGTGCAFRYPWSSGLLGRVLDAKGNALDGISLPKPSHNIPIDFLPPSPLDRKPIQQPLITGIKALDGFNTIGCGQRIGLFARPGMGKSTLLGQIAKNTKADCTVLALVGERGRELHEFIHRDLGKVGLQHSVVVCATSDAPAAERARALPVATTIAEGFRRQGHSVLLLVDSLTRHARALREIALASGESPGHRGFPPSVYDQLAQVIERAGNSRIGSISAIYTVLTENDPDDDPLAQEIEGLLDGHIILVPELAEAGCFPAIDPAASLSRLMDQMVTPEHRESARTVRRLWSAYQQRRDLIAAGAYEPGSEPITDQAINKMPKIVDFIRQAANEVSSFDETVEKLLQLANE
ncbi:MAG: FliI/YscN family ATPase [Deltaproteobacteria bacterium]|nr:FliI/YscN family ATPase [Deltaproteobacteria bacterium]